MKKIILSIFMLLSTTLFAGQNIGDIIIKDYKTGKVQVIKNFKKKTYIKVWASWCPICLDSLPHTNELSKEKNLDFNVITVVTPGSNGEQSEENFKKWFSSVREFKDIKVYYDNQNAIYRKLRIRGVPRNIFIDSDGNVVKILSGAIGNDKIKEEMSKIK